MVLHLNFNLIEVLYDRLHITSVSNRHLEELTLSAGEFGGGKFVVKAN